MMSYSLGQDGVRVFKKSCKLVEAVKRNGPWTILYIFLSRCLRQHTGTCFSWM